MPVILETNGKLLIAALSGEIDHHSAKTLREQIDISVRENTPDELIMDFSGVSFMDSSGIGLVMGRYKIMQEIGGKVTVLNPTVHIKKVMQLSGIDKLATIKSH
jgi:stage II sporulation protein AA (anti-sigma F factor antagonist)